MRATVLVLALVVACTAATVGAGPAAARDCPVATAPKTVAYEQIAGVPANLTSLDVWAPTPKCRVGNRRAPVVMWVHGGGYRKGDKRGAVADKVRLFNQRRGWIFVSVNYRLTRAADPNSARYPDHFRDVAAAVAWVRAHISAYGGNPHRIALLGHSAGADIVSNVTVNPTWLRERRLPLRSIRCAGPLDTEGFDKTRVPDSDPTSLQWRLAFRNNPDFRTNTSATLLARRGPRIPSTITVFRGTPARQATERAFASKLSSLGVKTALIDATSLTHEQVNRNIGAPGDTVMTRPLLRFLTTCLQRP